MAYWYFALTAVEWLLRLAMLPIVTRRRPASSAMAWLLIIFFQPIIGVVLYVLIGENRLPRKRVGLHTRLNEELVAVRRRFEHHENVVHPDLGPEIAPAITLAERLGYYPILGGNHVEFMTDTNEAIDRLIADIDGAARHVHLLFYIFAADATGRRVADALIRAEQRGVKVRVLVDAVGSRPMVKALSGELWAHGVEVREMLPVKFFRRRMARIDLRNHRKLAVIDGHIAYTGSQNIVDANYGHRDLAWHDIMVKITGPVTLELQAVFVSDWYFETDEVLNNAEVFPDPVLTGEVPVQALPSGPTYPTENYQRMLLAALHGARRRVIITTPYSVPDEPLMQAVQVAVLRGVEVIFVVPRRCDQILVGAAARAYYADFLDVGAKIFLYDAGLLHAKSVTIDDEISLIGSSNFDIRSFALNFELNLLLYGEEVTRELRQLQQGYIDRSSALTREVWRERSSVQRFIDNVARLFSPLL